MLYLPAMQRFLAAPRVCCAIVFIEGLIQEGRSTGWGSSRGFSYREAIEMLEFLEFEQCLLSQGRISVYLGLAVI